jgi:WD40 repeat protein
MTPAKPFGKTASVKKPTCMAFSPDGKILACGSQDGTITLLDAGTFDVRGRSGTAHKRVDMRHQDAVHAILGRGAITSLAWDPSGRMIVTGGTDSTVRRWNASTLAPMPPALTGHANSVRAVCFDAAGFDIFGASEDGSIRRWKTWTGKPTEFGLEPSINETPLYAMALEGNILAAGGEAGALDIWDLRSGEYIGTGSDLFIQSRIVKIIIAGKTLLAQTDQHSVLAVPTTDPRSQVKFWKHASSMCPSPDHRHLVLEESGNRKIDETGDLAHDMDVTLLKEGKSFPWPAQPIAYSPDGTMFVRVESDSALQRYEGNRVNNPIPLTPRTVPSPSQFDF